MTYHTGLGQFILTKATSLRSNIFAAWLESTRHAHCRTILSQMVWWRNLTGHLKINLLNIYIVKWWRMGPVSATGWACLQVLYLLLYSFFIDLVHTRNTSDLCPGPHYVVVTCFQGCSQSLCCNQTALEDSIHKGPFVLLQRFSKNGHPGVTNEITVSRTARSQTSIAHHTRLKPYKGTLKDTPVSSCTSSAWAWADAAITDLSCFS